jgi:hypothetical protein
VTPLEMASVVAAGGVAGAVNAIAGGGTLVSFPALVAVGLPPVQANTTNARAYRPELTGQSSRIRALLLPAVVGAVVGAALLLLLPSESFDAVAPWLVLGACLLIGLQPVLARWLTARGVGKPHPGWEVQLAVGVAAVYGAYFGAGLGVIFFAVLGLLVPDEPLRTSALRGLQSLKVKPGAPVVLVVASAWPAGSGRQPSASPWWWPGPLPGSRCSSPDALQVRLQGRCKRSEQPPGRRHRRGGDQRRHHMAEKSEQKSFRTPDETRSFELGEVEIVSIAGGEVGRRTLQPGWRWSKHVKPIAGTELCEAPHFQYHVSGGTLHIAMADGVEFESKPGDVIAVPEGHDAWVVGDEPVVLVDWHGATNYAKA